MTIGYWDKQGRRLTSLGRPVVTSMQSRRTSTAFSPAQVPRSLEKIRQKLEQEEIELKEWLAQSAPKVDVDSVISRYMDRSTDLRDEMLAVVLSAHAAADAVIGVNRVLAENLNMDDSRLDTRMIERLLTTIIRAKVFRTLVDALNIDPDDAKQMQSLFLAQLIPTGPRARPQPQQSARAREPSLNEIMDAIGRVAPGPERTR